MKIRHLNPACLILLNLLLGYFMIYARCYFNQEVLDSIVSELLPVRAALQAEKRPGATLLGQYIDSNVKKPWEKKNAAISSKSAAKGGKR